MIRLLAFIALAIAWAQLSPAHAASCSFTISTMNFGNVDTLSGAQADTTATLGITCSNVITGSVRVCPNIGAGSGGASGTTHYMRNAANAALSFMLYQDAGRATLWGSIEQTLLGTPPTIDLTTSLGGSISATRTLYGRVVAGQQTAATGSYASSFTASDVKISYSEVPAFSCLTLQSPVTAPFIVQASVLPNCLITAQDINFGAHGVLAANVDAQGGLSIRCTPGTAYAVGLNGGLANAAPAARRMTQGANFITYGLYQTAARNTLWGTGAGQTLAGSGTGALQSLPVYGRVPPQATPATGTYSDTIVATITY